MKMRERADIIKDICEYINQDEDTKAINILLSEYKFIPMGENKSRNYNHFEKLQVFLRDGFTDRYSGAKLFFPPVLKILSTKLPQDFPYQKNWRLDKCHIAYWELIPTIDHIIPVSRGGKDEFDNWICTSQLRNSIKSNWLLEELGWKLHGPRDLKVWDGMLNWFIEQVNKNNKYLDDTYIKPWYKAIAKANLILDAGV
ncbi:MAG: HNH endonuclease [Anaerolineales bacterium]|nr:HNH endonuclease [Anaerolineales bacterium]